MQVGGVSVLSSLGGTNPPAQVASQQPTQADVEYQGVAHLIGPASARPAADGRFFDGMSEYGYIYEDHQGSRSFITQDDDGWQTLNYNQQVNVFSASDLPAPTGGTHTLEDNTAYCFNGFVTSPHGLELGNSTPLLGRHGSLDGFIHTGTNTALTGTDAGFFARDMYFHAPGGTMFDLAGDQSTEMLVESCSFSDAAGIGQMASLGTIDGYRVPSFKGCNFEHFAAGLIFDGAPDKIFISGSPMRSVTASGVTILTFAGSLDVDIVDMPDNYVKDVQSDTEVIHVETGGSPTDIFQYRGTTHDSSVTTSNILTGEAGEGVVGYRIDNAYPLRDSAVVGELSLDAPTTVTIPAQDTWTTVGGTTSLGNESVRVSQPAAGILQYDGRKNTNVHITASCTVEAPSNESFAMAIAKNGTIEPTSEAQGEGQGNAPAFVAPSGIEDLTTGDALSLQIKNLSSASDITVNLYNLNFSGV